MNVDGECGWGVENAEELMMNQTRGCKKYSHARRSERSADIYIYIYIWPYVYIKTYIHISRDPLYI